MPPGAAVPTGVDATVAQAVAEPGLGVGEAEVEHDVPAYDGCHGGAGLGQITVHIAAGELAMCGAPPVA